MSKEHAQNTLGQLISASAERDAIHIAIAPIQASVTMSPGVAVGADGKPDTKPKVGIVDPFLRGLVKSGEWFWLFLYPNTITGLSHVWSHPAFPAAPGRDKGRDLIEKVAGICGKEYQEFIEDVRMFSLGDHEWPDYIMDNSELYKNVELEILLEMWRLFEATTGVRPHKNLYDPTNPEYAHVPYTCSC